VLRIALVLTALPFLASFVSLVAAGADGPRNHDVALIELRSSDVLGGDLPLVGSYERFGGNQPGPWLFWLLALPSLAGAIGIGAAVLVVGYCAVAGSMWVARRRGGSILVMWTALLSVLMALGRGFDRLTDPWEPMISLFLVVLAVMLVWEVAAGTWGALPWMVAVTWFLASSWLMLTPMAAMLGVVGLAAVALRWYDVVRSGDPVERRRAFVWTIAGVGVLVLMALPTVIEQLTSTPGNLTELRSAATSPASTVGVSGGWRALRLQFDLWAPWLGRSLPVTFSSEVDGSSAFAVPSALVVWISSMVALLVAGRRTRRSGDGERVVVSEALGDPAPPWWLHAGIGAVFIGLLVGLSLSRGGVAVWSMQPTAALAMLLWLATGWTVTRLVLVRRSETWSTCTAMVLAASLVVVVAVSTVAALRSDQGLDRLPGALAELADAVPDEVPVGSGPFLVTSDAEVDEVFESVDFGVAELITSLDRRGVRTVVEPDLAPRFGGRRSQPERAAGELRIESGAARPDGDGWTMVRRVDPLTPGERRRRGELDREIEEASNGADGADLLRVAAADPRLAALLRESADLPSDPPLSLWYRTAR